MPISQKDTDGYVGLLRLFTQEMVKESQNDAIVGGRDPIRTAMNRYYLGPIFHSLVAQRAGFSAAHLSLSPVQLVLRNILENTTPILAPPEIHDTRDNALSPEDKAKRTLLRSVVVVSVNDAKEPTRRILEFATPVHRRFWFREAYPSTINRDDFNARVGNSIDMWLRFVLQTFDPQALANPSSHGNGTHLLPLEWTFQHEFWRGASMMLPREMRVAAEVSKVMQRSTLGRTRVDFWINSTLNLAVELMRNTGDAHDIEKHLNRFRAKGSYYNLAPTQWRVIDFRAPGADPVEAAADRQDGLIIVCCHTEFKRATVYFGKNTAEDIFFHGKVVLH